MRKTRQVEENIKKVEREAQDLNENYRLRESDNFRKLRELGEVEFELGLQLEQGRQLELQNRRLREDVEVLEGEIAKRDRTAADLKAQAAEERERFYLELKAVRGEAEAGALREAELRRAVEEAEKRYLLAIGKLNAAEELKARNRELEIKV